MNNGIYSKQLECRYIKKEHQTKKLLIDTDNNEKRETGEIFQAIIRRKRLICAISKRRSLGSVCRRHIDRNMQLRSVTYDRAQKFTQNERYLSQYDTNLFR